MTSLLHLIILFKTIRPTPTQSYFSPHPATHSCAFLAPVLTQPHAEQTLGIQTRKILLLFFWQIRFATAQLAEMSVSTGNQCWWEEGGEMPTGPAPGVTSPSCPIRLPLFPTGGCTATRWSWWRTVLKGRFFANFREFPLRPLQHAHLCQEVFQSHLGSYIELLPGHLNTHLLP